MQESDSLQTSVSVGKESCWRVGKNECDELITGSLALFVLEASADFESFLTTIINAYATFAPPPPATCSIASLTRNSRRPTL